MVNKFELAGHKSLLIEFAVDTQHLIIKVIRDHRYINYAPFNGINSITKDQLEISEIKHQLYTQKADHYRYIEISLRIKEINEKYMHLMKGIADYSERR